MSELTEKEKEDIDESLGFLPENYKVPSKDNGYMKFKLGVNKIRFMGVPILGYEMWKDTEDGRRPVRFRMDEDIPMADVPEDGVKHFWAAVVWNFEDELLQILEITQRGIQKSIMALQRSEAWGDPREYDIEITREGEGLETRYSLIPGSRDLDPGIDKFFKDSDINLEALFDGKNPFDGN